MGEAIKTNIQASVVEAVDQSAVPHSRGQLIIEDSGSLYYDSTLSSSVEDRVALQKSSGKSTHSGGRAFKIISAGVVDATANTGYYEISDVTGIEPGIYVSPVLQNAHYHKMTVASVDTETNRVIVNNYVHENHNSAADNAENCAVYNFLIIEGRPDLGDMEVGFNAVAFGQDTFASNLNAFAEGMNNLAIGKNSHAEGKGTIAGHIAHSEGAGTQALGAQSHAEGNGTVASGSGAHSEGNKTQATSEYAHTEGIETVASAAGAHAEGYKTTATARYAHAEGQEADATGNAAHAEGYGTVASGVTAHAEGDRTTASGSHAHAEGYSTEATKNNAHAEGQETHATAENAHAEGLYSTASQKNAHAEGYGTEANGYQSHSEGNYTKANGSASHSEGLETIASGDSQHVQGKYNIEDTNNEFAHIVGNGSRAKRSNAHTLDWDGNAWFAGSVLVGEDNIDLLAKIMELSETSSGGYKELTTTTESDIDEMSLEDGLYYWVITSDGHTYWLFTWNGGPCSGSQMQIRFGGDHYNTCSRASIQSRYKMYNTTTWSNWTSMTNTDSGDHPVNIGSGENSVEEPLATALGYATYAGGTSTVGVKGYYYYNMEFTDGGIVLTLTKEQNVEPSEAFTIPYQVGDVVSIINGSKYYDCSTIIAVNNNQITLDTAPFEMMNDVSSWGVDDRAIWVNAKAAEGEASLSHYAHGEGENTIARERASHAEGRQTSALGQYSHAEGQSTTASGVAAHSEGTSTQAQGNNSHAEGGGTIAKSDGSHAEGQGTIANGTAQHVQGKYNIEDTEGKYAHIQGGGTSGSESDRRNIHTIDWEGNAWFEGEITVGTGKEKLATVTEVTEMISSITPGVTDTDEAVTTTGTGSAYEATVLHITALKAGVSFIMIPNVVSTNTAPTLNVNNLGAKQIRRRRDASTGTVTTGPNASWLAANTPIRVIYDGTYWIVEGTGKPNAGDIEGLITISKGGTGTNMASSARVNLGICNTIIIGNSTYNGAADYVCTGTDDQATFREAIDELITQSEADYIGKIIVLPGTYNFSNTLVLDHALGNVIIEGLVFYDGDKPRISRSFDGASATANNPSYLIDIQCDNVVLKNLLIDGKNAVYASHFNTAIGVSPSTVGNGESIIIDSVDIEYSAIGIWTKQKLNNSIIKNCNITGFLRAGVWLVEADNTTIENCYCKGTSVDDSYFGISIEGVGNIIKNNKSESAAVCIFAAGTDYSVSYNICSDFGGSYVSNSAHGGITIGGFKSRQGARCSVIGNVCCNELASDGSTYGCGINAGAGAGAAGTSSGRYPVYANIENNVCNKNTAGIVSWAKCRIINNECSENGVGINAGINNIVSNNYCIDNTRGIDCLNNTFVTGNYITRGTGTEADYTDDTGKLYTTVYVNGNGCMISNNYMAGKDIHYTDSSYESSAMAVNNKI